MSANELTRGALVKRLKTQPSPERIALILEALALASPRLQALSQGLSDAQLRTPLGEGERSFKRNLTHLNYCAERGSDHIHHALLLDKPHMPRIHAERDWGKLMRYEAFAVPELLAYFDFRRRALLGILRGLSDEQWTRTVRREGVKREESVYYAARGLCLHELAHLEDLASKSPPSVPPSSRGEDETLRSSRFKSQSVGAFR